MTFHFQFIDRRGEQLQRFALADPGRRENHDVQIPPRFLSSTATEFETSTQGGCEHTDGADAGQFLGNMLHSDDFPHEVGNPRG